MCLDTVTRENPKEWREVFHSHPKLPPGIQDKSTRSFVTPVSENNSLFHQEKSSLKIYNKYILMKCFSRSKFHFFSRGLLAFVLVHSYFQGPAHPYLYLCAVQTAFNTVLGFFISILKEKKKEKKWAILVLKCNLSFL